MQRIFRTAGTILSLVAVVCAPAHTQPSPKQHVSITVSAAISLKDALDEMGRAYEKAHPEAKVTFNYGSSGTLQHQIEQGAPIDVFVSASERQMDALSEEGVIITSTRHDLIRNVLVLIVSADSQIVNDLGDLLRPDVKTIALGEPTTVPAGMYAQQTLRHLGLLAAVEKKAVYAKDVREVLTYVETGNVDAGFVYRTDAMSSSKVRVVTAAPEDSHAPIVYPVAVVSSSKSAAPACAFLDFLDSSLARDIFTKFGFAPAEKQALRN